MFKVCALMSIYNEEDIIEESVSKLIASGVDVYVIDNGSTDKTIEKISHLVGRGVVEIKTLHTEEDNKKVYKWELILEQIEKISKILMYDWFIFVDADEIRYSPWPGYSLLEGVERVNNEGYNLINFKLFNFRVNEKTVSAKEFENSLTHYSKPEENTSIQIKAWKKTEIINITQYGGHIASVPNPKLYPVKFIHKHYPIRSIEHGFKKLRNERLNIYSEEEKNKGWHLHYSDVNFETLKGIIWKESELKFYSHNEELLQIHVEANELVVNLINKVIDEDIEKLLDGVINSTAEIFEISREKAKEILMITSKIINLYFSSKMPNLMLEEKDKKIITYILKFYNSYYDIKGMPLHARGIQKIITIIK
jgi:hypothetical protein